MNLNLIVLIFLLLLIFLGIKCLFQWNGNEIADSHLMLIHF